MIHPVRLLKQLQLLRFPVLSLERAASMNFPLGDFAGEPRTQVRAIDFVH